MKNNIENKNNLSFLENNLEEINNKIKNLKTTIDEKNKTISISNIKKIIVYCFPLIVSLISFGGISIFIDISDKLLSIIGAGIVVNIMFDIPIKQAVDKIKEEIKDYENQLDINIKLKEEYEKQISNINNINTPKNNDNPSNIKHNTYYNDINTSYNHNEKKLVLKLNNNTNSN